MPLAGEGWRDVLALDDALARLLAAARPLPAEEVPLDRAAGRSAAVDVWAPESLPRLAHAAMDGFACRTADVAAARPDRPVRLRVTGSARAGQPPGKGPGPGEAWSIVTGAPLPAGADRVIPLEHARRDGRGGILVTELGTRDHVVRPGETLAAGAPLLAAGRPVTAHALAGLAAAGIDRVWVHRRPRVALLATGDEVVAVGAAGVLPPGKIFNATGPALAADLRRAGYAVEERGIAGDDPGALRDALRAALASGCDVVVTTGGVSVGARDRVHRTWLDLGVRRVAGRVDLKPGGPFFAGLAGDVWVVALPGSPTAALAAHHLLLRPLLARLSGLALPVRPVRPVRLAAAVAAAGFRTRVLWARVEFRGPGGLEAYPLAPHPDGALAGLAGADALLLLPAGTPPLPAGALAPALLLDLPEAQEDLACRPPLPLVVGLVGASGSGKTLVAEGLARRLSAAGLMVAAVKHAAHGFDLDRPGSDSTRLAEGGAGVVVLAGPAETALRVPLPGGRPPASAEEAAALAAAAAAHHLGSPPRVILVEGFAHPHRPVVVVEPVKEAAHLEQVPGRVLDRIAPRLLDPGQLERRLDELAHRIRALAPPAVTRS